MFSYSTNNISVVLSGLGEICMICPWSWLKIFFSIANTISTLLSQINNLHNNERKMFILLVDLHHTLLNIVKFEYWWESPTALNLV
jgi:hypothetical protein